MKSTMQDRPLTIPAIVRHAAAVPADTEVITTTAAATWRSTFGEVIDRASRVAAGLREPGVATGDRVGTFCWNSTGVLVGLAGPLSGTVIRCYRLRPAAAGVPAGRSTAEPSQWLACSASSTSWRLSPTGRPRLSSALRIRYWTVFLCSVSCSAVVL